MKLKKFKQHFKGWGFNNQGIERKIKQQLNEELLILEQIEEQAFLSLEQVQKKGTDSEYFAQNVGRRGNVLV